MPILLTNMSSKIAIKFGFPTSDERMENIEIEAENHDLDLQGGWNHFMMCFLPKLLVADNKGSYFDRELSNLLGEEVISPEITFDTYIKVIGSESIQLPSYILWRDCAVSKVSGRSIQITDQNLIDWCNTLAMYLDINEVTFKRLD
jgi:hypothetical protein